MIKSLLAYKNQR